MKITMDGKYQTRDGSPVRVLCVDRKQSGFPVLAVAGQFEHEIIQAMADGSAHAKNGPGCDLIEAPREYEGWVNVYPPRGDNPPFVAGPYLHATAARAADMGTDKRIACLHLKFREGEGIDA